MVRRKDPSRNRSVRLPEKLWTRIERHAEELTSKDPDFRYSMNDVIRRALEKYLPESPPAEQDEDEAEVEAAPLKSRAAKKVARRR